MRFISGTKSRKKRENVTKEAFSKTMAKVSFFFILHKLTAAMIFMVAPRCTFCFCFFFFVL